MQLMCVCVCVCYVCVCVCVCLCVCVQEAGEEEVMVGPSLPGQGGVQGNYGNFGGYLRPGEGDAMLAYVQVRTCACVCLLCVWLVCVSVCMVRLLRVCPFGRVTRSLRARPTQPPRCHALCMSCASTAPCFVCCAFVSFGSHAVQNA